MRLIDADALSESIKRGAGTDLQKFFADVCVATAPTVDAVQVVRCKVGDTLFRVFAGEILEHKVRNMRYLAIQGRWDIDTTPFCSYVESSIGKTIFLTYEQAERALEAMKDGNG